jgi:hypothetical protein
MAALESGPGVADTSMTEYYFRQEKDGARYRSFSISGAAWAKRLGREDCLPIAVNRRRQNHASTICAFCGCAALNSALELVFLSPSTATRLANGEVLIVGGYARLGGSAINHAWIYRP